MRVPSSVLAALCAVTLVAELSPAWAQTDADVRKALSDIKASFRDYGQCARATQCAAFFDSFGVGLAFSDGSIAPFAHAQRLSASAHDCILNARASLDRGDKAMAVQWVMAARIDDPGVRNWLGDHPEAVLEALRHCCF
jgi:hypothetical protein